MTKHIFPLLLVLLSCQAAQSQTVIIDGLPRDTSFTVHSAYNGAKRHFPFIKPVFPTLPEGVVSKEGIVYAKLDKRELHVDIYRPDDKETYPALIMVHGGGWNSGDRSMEVPMAQMIASKGYVTIPVEYHR